MRRNPLPAILGAAAIVFVAVIGFYWLQEGSLEGAGARMDDDLAKAGNTIEDVTEDTVDAVDDAIDDATDGDDDTY